MAHRLRTINNHQSLSGKNQALGMIERLHPPEDKRYPKEVLEKKAALERLSGVKNSSKTYYSELKKSFAQMHKCNNNLTQTQKEI